MSNDKQPCKDANIVEELRIAEKLYFSGYDNGYTIPAGLMTGAAEIIERQQAEIERRKKLLHIAKYYINKNDPKYKEIEQALKETGNG